MSAAVAPAPRTSSVPGIGNAISSEFTKFLSVRSTRVTLITSLVVSAIVAAILTMTLPATRKTDLVNVPPEDVFTSPLLGVDAAAIVMFVATASYFGAEFAKKQGVATFTITPRRDRVLVAKIVVVTAVGIVIGILATLIAAAVGQVVAGALGAESVGLLASSSLQVMGGSSLQPLFYGILVGLFAVIARNASAAIAAGFAVVLILPAFAGFLPPVAADIVAPLLPRAAFDSLAGVAESGAPEQVPLWWAVALLVIWLGGAFAVAARTLGRRDV